MRWALVASLALLAAMAWPMAHGRVHTHDDLGAFHLPLRAFYAERLSHGEPWDWMPQLFSGFYLTGEGQLGSYHPLHRALYRWLPLPVAFELELWLSYPFMLVGTWLWLRRRLGRPDAAMLGALVWTFSGFNLLRFVHPNAVAVTAHLPWLLWTIDVATTDPHGSRRARALMAVALLTGSQLLLGYPQYVWLSLVAEAVWAGFVLWQRGEKRVAAVVLAVGVAKLLGLLLGAIQVLPTLDALAHSSRSLAGPASAEVGAVSPWDLAQVVGPYLYRERAWQFPAHEYPLYFGAVPLALAAWLISRRAHWGRMQPAILAAVGLALVALVLAFGQAGQLGRVVGLLPLVGGFRCPGRHLVLAHLAVAGLAAMAFVRLSQAGRRASHHGSFKALWTVLALSVAVAGLGLAFRHRLPIAATKYVLAGPLLLAAAAWLVARAERGARWAPQALILLAGADLGAYGLGYAILRHTHPLDEYIARAANPPVPAAPAKTPGADLHPDQPTFGTENTIVLAGWRRTDGYAGLEPLRRLDYGQLASLRAAGVRWVRANRRTRQIAGLIDRGQGWLEVPDPLPRIRLVSQTMRSQHPARDIARIGLEATVLTEKPIDLPPLPSGKWSIVSQRPGRLELETACPGRQMLVLTEGFDRGWWATVDGRPREVLRVNGDFLGCPIDAGSHRVVLEFRPRSLQVGQTLSVFGLIVSTACGISTILPGKYRSPFAARCIARPGHYIGS